MPRAVITAAPTRLADDAVPAPGRRLADYAAWAMVPALLALAEHDRGLGAHGLHTFPLGALI